MRQPALAFCLFALAIAGLPLAAGAVGTDDPALRPSAQLIFKHPELLRAGQCVRYEEGGHGWILSEPLYYLRGEVIGAEVRTRKLGSCPRVAGKTLKQYNRQEYNRLVQASPCSDTAEASQAPQHIGMVRLRVSDWETPYERKAENAGRLWRGMFIERKLEKGLEIELEADLLSPCQRE
ncbi:hypothetical protein VX159_14565 [Dechloromonas sp. ZY10]|uniref:hypothetical protein n=1 Tax=Dechloromonas aquae TaxID=2664436 RepID=UPI0035276DC5